MALVDGRTALADAFRVIWGIVLRCSSLIITAAVVVLLLLDWVHKLPYSVEQHFYNCTLADKDTFSCHIGNFHQRVVLHMHTEGAQ